VTDRRHTIKNAVRQVRGALGSAHNAAIRYGANETVTARIERGRRFLKRALAEFKAARRAARHDVERRREVAA